MDEFERVEMYLARNLTNNIYFPIKSFIESINTEEKTYDLGHRIELFKLDIEAEMKQLKESMKLRCKNCKGDKRLT